MFIYKCDIRNKNIAYYTITLKLNKSITLTSNKDIKHLTEMLMYFKR